MSFDPKHGAGRKDVKYDPEVVKSEIMAEHSNLPNLDYRKLQIANLAGIARGRRADIVAAKGPEGRFQGLISYLGQRSSGATTVDAAELDRRLRTWFEDMITQLLASPKDWDQDRTLNGRALMDYLAGTKNQSQAPDAPAPATPPQEPGV